MATIGHAPREPDAPPPSNASRPPRRGALRRPRLQRARRWMLLGGGALASLVLLALGSAWWFGSHLDHPWVKARVLALARAGLRLAIDYDGAELSLRSGLRARSFRLLTPPTLAAGAPDAVRIERLELETSLWAFAFGQRAIDALRAGSVHVAMVRDESGRTSFGELFPAEPEASDEPTRVSQSLRGLPGLSIEVIEVERISGELVELRADGSRRVSSASGLSLQGSLHSDAEGLAGTALVLSGAPLALALGAGPPRFSATLHTRLELRAVKAQSLSLQAVASELTAHGLDVGVVSWRGPLLALNATLHTEPEAGRAVIALERSYGLNGQLALDGRSELFDASGLRVVTTGRARVDLASLPHPIGGVSMEALELELATRELAWDGARVAGAIEYTGQLRSARLGDAQRSVQLAGLTLAGQGSFEATEGRFQSNLKAQSLAAYSLAGSVDATDVTLDASGTIRELAGAQAVEVQAGLAVATARITAPGQRLELDGARLDTKLAGTTRDFDAQLVPKLDAELAVRHLVGELAGSAGFRRVSTEGLRSSLSARALTRDGRAALGVRGDANVTLSIPALELADGRAARARSRARLSFSGLTAAAALPLSLERASGGLSITQLADADGFGLAELALDIEAEAPLAWGAGGARARANGQIAKLWAADGNSAAQLSLGLRVAEPERERYRLELDATSPSVSVVGVKLGGPVAATLRADAARAGELKLSGEVRGARGAAITLALDARFERASERLAYAAQLSADKLDAFGELVGTLVPAARRTTLEGARLRASAQGDLSGVLRAAEGALPVLGERPLATARGTQSAELELGGLDYRGERAALRIPSLALTIESTHRAEAGGSASARLRLSELAFEGGGRSLRLTGLDQAIVASFEQAPDRGVVDVDTALEVASAAQSWLPGFPVRGLRLSSNLQIDRLRSIFLRELALDHPASGSALRAAGTLELLAQGSPGGGKTIVGREALSFEGRLTQQLQALEGLELAAHARGALELPFRLESGGMLGYRLIAALEAKQVSLSAENGAFAIEQLNGVVPVIEEFALLESGPVIGAGPRTSPLSDTRFFDVHPFLSGSDYVTAQSLRFGRLAPIGPIAANVRVDRSDFIIDQLQAGYQGGQIVGQVRAAWRDGDPIVRLRLNATGVRSGKSRDVFDANTALTFVPAAMTLDGKMQIVRASREHLDDILDVLDPFHESANANRVRRALTLGYPKFVRFHLHDGAVDTKVELGGIAELVRIDEIKAVPLGPILQKYVAPALPALPRRAAESAPAPASADVPVASAPPRQQRTKPRVMR